MTTAKIAALGVVREYCQDEEKKDLKRKLAHGEQMGQLPWQSVEQLIAIMAIDIGAMGDARRGREPRAWGKEK